MRIVVLGIGNEMRGDDAAGVLVARALPSRGKRLFAIDGGSAPENFTGPIIKARPTHVVIVDSAWMGQEPGEIRVIEAASVDGASFSTHTLPASVLIDYLRRSIGCEAVTIGIQPAQAEYAAPMTPSVARAVDLLASLLAKAGKSR